MKGIARHSQFAQFRKLAQRAKFGRIRQSDLKSRATLDTDGADEAAAGVGVTVEFLNDTSTVLAVRTLEPRLRADTPTGNEYIYCARAATLLVNQQTTTFSETELMEICSKFSRKVLQLVTGQDCILEKQAGFMVSGAPGIVVHEDATNAAAGTPNVTVRANIIPSKEGEDLDDPLLIFPGASIKAILHGEGAWTSTDDVPVDLIFHGWLAYRGSVEAGQKVLSMQEAIEKPDLVDSAMARA
jgi:hypothetical protein